MRHVPTLSLPFGKGLIPLLVAMLASFSVLASSHREAPLIANDPLADNTDLYAFRSPDNPDMITIIANYIPFQLPHGGPNYYTFGENIRYEIHVDNDVSTPGDDIVYRFTFHKEFQDPSTFFYIRLGAENNKTTYTLERSMNGGDSFQTLISNGVVPPNNIGDRSISGFAGLSTDYATLMSNAITTAGTGEKVFAGPVDDPFYVDLGGVFDLGDLPRQNSGAPRDGVGCLNVSTIAIQVPISVLQKDGQGADMAANILDGNYVIGVWASASRPMIRTLKPMGEGEMVSGDWVQVSRLGMPLTNEAVIPVGFKDHWNSLSPYEDLAALETFGNFFYNPELGLYMDDSQFGGAVPAFSPLRIQRNSLGAFDFGNGQDGLFPLKGNPALDGTALDDAVFGTLLLPGPGSPRSVDLWPAFHTGVPNLRPYQLATGKGGDPLAEGKPFINNFLPNGGDMLRLNMAVPPTPRNDPNFSSLGLLQAAVLGLLDPTYANPDLQFIPNMDGFPNGRRLEDDVTRIELQAVSGVVLAAIGLWYDDFTPGESSSPLTQDLLDVLTYSTGVTTNDTLFKEAFPYVQTPWSGTGKCSGMIMAYEEPVILPANRGPIVSSFQVTTRDNNEIVIANLMDGDVIDLSKPGMDRVNFRALTVPGMVGSVEFEIFGTLETSRTENDGPYFLFGDNPKNGKNNARKLRPGNYTLKATAYTGAKMGGMPGPSLMVSFTVVNEMVEMRSETSFTEDMEATVLAAYPNPVRDRALIRLGGSFTGEVQINLIDMNGRTVRELSIEKHEGSMNTELSVEGLPTGTYTMVAVQDGSILKQVQLVKAE